MALLVFAADDDCAEFFRAFVLLVSLLLPVALLLLLLPPLFGLDFKFVLGGRFLIVLPLLLEVAVILPLPPLPFLLLLPVGAILVLVYFGSCRISLTTGSTCNVITYYRYVLLL